MEKIDFNAKWFFCKEEFENDVEQINLPHDAMIKEERKECLNGKSTGYYPGGKYIYKKEFEVSDKLHGKSVILEFEGVYQQATILVNGKEVCFHPYGYTGFFVDVTEYLLVGQSNEIIVKVDNSGEPNTRWYSGSGIYRPVWMHVGEKIHISPEGVQITTLSHNPAKVRVKTVLNTAAVAAGLRAMIEIQYQGQTIVTAEGFDATVEIPDAKLWSESHPALYDCKVQLRQGNIVTDAQMEKFGICHIAWSTKGLFINGEETKLRGACIHHDNGVLGACEYKAAALRRAKILKEAGFNAIRMAHNPASKALLEACDETGLYMVDEFSDMWYEHKNRYDYATYFEEWHERDLKAMVEKDRNHPSVIMYSIGNEVTETSQPKGIQLTKKMTDFVHGLDESRPVTCGINMSLNVMNFAGMGVYKPGPEEPVIDKGPKNPRAMELLKQMMPANAGAVKSQENPLDAIQGQPDGKESGKLVGSEYFNKMMVQMKEQQAKVVKQEIAKILSEEAYSYLDIAGYNYAVARYESDKEDYPKRVSFGSETLPQKIYSNWREVKKLPYVVGDFIWTGWDYIGEAGVGAFCYDSVGSKNKDYPFLLAGCGVIDILGQPRPEVWLNKAVYGLTKAPYIGVEPVTHSDENHLISAWRFSDAVRSWSWAGCEGKNAEIIIYADADTVELIQDGKSLDKKEVSECMVQFSTIYHPGELIAIAYDKEGKETGRDILKTASEETVLQLIPEKTILHADGQDLCYLNINLADQKGIVKTSEEAQISIEVSGAGTLAGAGNAAPCSEHIYTAPSIVTYYGRAQAVIRAGYEKGEITVRIQAEESDPQEIKIKVI